MADKILCAKCASDKVIPRATLVDRADYNIETNLVAKVYADPDAFLFKGAQRSEVVARICGQCGYVELYVENPEDLWESVNSQR